LSSFNVYQVMLVKLMGEIVSPPDY